MVNQTDIDRIKELQENLTIQAHAYYVLDDPIVTDADYDRDFNELVRLETAHPEFKTADSPTNRVGGAPIDEFDKVEHRQPMLSLGNASDNQEVREFCQRVQKELNTNNVKYIVEPKIDGVGISLIYEDGNLVRASTRGDGKVGEDVTLNARTIRSIPLKLRDTGCGIFPAIIEIRGEVYCEKDKFNRFNSSSKAERVYSNPRNFAAGSLRQLESTKTAERPVDAIFYSVGAIEGFSFSSQMEMLMSLEDWGLKVAKDYIHECGDIDEVICAHNKLESIRNSVPYEIDGSVIKVNSFEYQKALGSRSRTPRWAIAGKFVPQQESTILENIEVSVGRSGIISPVACLKSVNIGGVNITSALLCNQDEIDRLDVRIGDHVVIERAGDVIPKIVKVLTQHRDGTQVPFRLPSTCPSCGTSLVESENEVAIRCTYYHCPEQIKGRIKHFASKDALDIDGLGDKIVSQLVDTFTINRISEVFGLSSNDISRLDRQGDRSAEKLINSINKKKNTTLPRFIYGLCIKHVGRSTSEILSSYIFNNDSSDPISYFMGLTYDEVIALDDIGEATAKSMVDFLAQERNQNIIKSCVAGGMTVETPKAATVSILSGKSFCVTGKLSKTRDEIHDLIKNAGGKVSKSVGKSIDYLVAGEKAGSKIKKAEAAGVTVISEDDLGAMISA